MFISEKKSNAMTYDLLLKQKLCLYNEVSDSS